MNPHDADEVADALDTALNMSLAERQARWRANWDVLRGTSAMAWGRSFVAALLRSAVEAGPGDSDTASRGSDEFSNGQAFPLGKDMAGMRLN